MNKTAEYNKALKEFDEWYCKKVDSLVSTATPDNPMLKNHIAQFYQDLDFFVLQHPQFKKEEYKSSTVRHIELSNDFGYGCDFIFFLNETGGFKTVEIRFLGSAKGNINCADRLSFVYRYLAWLASLSEKFNQLSELKKEAENDRIKKERIRELQTNSAEEWLKNIMKDSIYPYRLEQSTATLTLHIKITPSRQICIPILKEKFQKTIPQILETIKQCEDFIKEIKIKGTLINKVSSSKSITWENT